jgi:hypothetical protein
MKNTFKWFVVIAIVAAIGFSMAACDDGSSGPGGVNTGGNTGGSGLVGKWYASQGMADAGGTPAWEFRSDGRLIYGGSMNYTYTATSNTISVSVQGTFIGTYNYTISGNVLKITDPERPYGGGTLLGTWYKH